MNGLECSEILFSNINLGDRCDADYFTKKYIKISKRLAGVSTLKLGNLATTVASAFYPAATQLYSSGDTVFVRCVDCINNPIITKEQDGQFEKIPYEFGKKNKGISFLRKGDIVITKVGTPCFASIINEYDEVALSRTVLGLTSIRSINPYYLMIFLRCKYGFEQLYRQRELTIQYQLTLPRVRAIDVYNPSQSFQSIIHKLCQQYITYLNQAKWIYASAEALLKTELGLNNFAPPSIAVSIKSYSGSFNLSGRIDAEYYQPKYDYLFDMLSRFETKPLGGQGGLVNIKKSIEPGSDFYVEEGIPFVRVSDVSKYGISPPEIRLPFNVVSNIKALFPQKDTILFSKDGSVGIAYKMENDDKIITSGALLHLSVKKYSEILPDYLTLVLNSIVVQLQAERDSNGAIIQHWKPSEIEKVVIPILEMDIQKEIAAKVQKSFSLRHQSEQLLEISKRAVEIAIEQGERIALVWLKNKGVEG